MNKIVDLVSSVPLKVPPLREINHEINLIDPHKQIKYCLPKCPNALKEELADKIGCYTSAGWWVSSMLRKIYVMCFFNLHIYPLSFVSCYDHGHFPLM